MSEPVGRTPRRLAAARGSGRGAACGAERVRMRPPRSARGGSRLQPAVPGLEFLLGKMGRVFDQSPSDVRSAPGVGVEGRERRAEDGEELCFTFYLFLCLNLQWALPIKEAIKVQNKVTKIIICASMERTSIFKEYK